MSKKNKSAVPAKKLSPIFVFANIIVLLVIATILLVALFSYQVTDPAWSHNDGGIVQNVLGTIGAWYSDLSFSILGKMSYLIPIALIAFAVQMWLGKGIDKEILSWRLFMLLTAIISGCVLLAKHDPAPINEVALTGGGALGAWLTIGLEKSIKSVPAIMAFSTIIFIISMTLLLNLPWLKLAEWIGKGVSFIFGALFSGFRAGKSQAKAKRDAKKINKPDLDNEALQDNINRLNKLVGEKKASKKPTFSIDRYQEEEQPAADNPIFPQREPLNTDNDLPNDETIAGLVEPQQKTEKPTRTAFILQPKAENPATSDNSSIDQGISIADEGKAEPSFFDFGSIKPKKADVELQPEPIQPEPALEPISEPVQIQPEPIVSEPIKPIEQPEQEIFDLSKSAQSGQMETTIEPGEALRKAMQEEAQPVAPAPEPTPASAPAPEPTAEVTQSAGPTISAEAAAATAATLAATATATNTVNKVSIGKAYDSHEEAAAKKPVPVVHSLPSIDLLDTPPPQKNAYTEDVLAEMAGVLERTLKQFNVEATVMHVSPGPVITRFEVDLAPGIQAKKITSLSVDLARALAVNGVRVEEVIPGSSYVGLEVPNKQRQIVYFKDIVRSKAFQDSKSPLTLSLGSDTSGKPITADLMKMPHALVAGTTGSGKSVCINVMLLSMLYKASPKDLRLILVDPKMLEMSMYEDIPHLLTPVITDMNEAENALTWAVGEMERRYQLMAAMKVRKIDAFNQAIDDAAAKGESIKDPLWQPDESVGYTHHPDLERLPFIVIVIDELADMMMVVGKQVEQLIARLTQKARAAGIHVILATQRPSTDVLTGLIKANVPTRIAFQVSSGTDSRVIIDSVGAEKLLGHGDMLFVPPGAGHPQRLHGAFVDDAETDRITTFLRSMGEPDYIHGITGKQDPETLGAFGAAEAANAKEDADPLYEEAIQIVLQTGKASISSVQRQLRIGYNRAARMIEDMQEQGIVSEPVNGVRKVLAAPPPPE